MCLPLECGWLCVCVWVGNPTGIEPKMSEASTCSDCACGSWGCDTNCYGFSPAFIHSTYSHSDFHFSFTYLKVQELCVILQHTSRVGALCSYLGRRHRVCSIVDKQMVIAVQLEHVEAQHKALQDRVRLEGDDAVQVALVLWPEHGSIDFAIELLQKVILAQWLHVVWKRKKRRKKRLQSVWGIVYEPVCVCVCVCGGQQLLIMLNNLINCGEFQLSSGFPSVQQ